MIALNYARGCTRIRWITYQMVVFRKINANAQLFDFSYFYFPKLAQAKNSIISDIRR